MSVCAQCLGALLRLSAGAERFFRHNCGVCLNCYTGENRVFSEMRVFNAFTICFSSTFTSARSPRHRATPAVSVLSRVNGSYAEIPRLRLGMTRLFVRKLGCHSKMKARSLAHFRWSLAIRHKGKSTPIPLFTNCTQGMAQDAYLKDELTASATANISWGFE